MPLLVTVFLSLDQILFNALKMFPNSFFVATKFNLPRTSFELKKAKSKLIPLLNKISYKLLSNATCYLISSDCMLCYWRINYVRLAIEVSWETSGELSFFENCNFFMVDLRHDFVSGHLLYSMSITYKLYDTNLLWSTYLKIIDLKVQYCKGREFLLLAPLA